MTLGSLFDGIGGFPLAGLGFGITPVWASEIEPFPIRVTKERFPDMQHVGDITKLNGADLPPVDIITGGSPCQDLSVAGKRAGLQGARSGLFMEQVRVIKEARAKFGKPRFMVWENVPGAFSSAGGEDFRAVIEETARIAENGVSIPRPADGGWAGAGCIMADTWSIAWRVLDAQFWGVPQRRRRIFLVADFGGQSAPEILFKSESVSGNTAESGTQGEGAAEGIEGGAGTASAFDAYNFATNTVAQTCRAEQLGPVMTASFEPGAITRDMGIRHWEEMSPSLRAEAGDNQPAVYGLVSKGNGEAFLMKEQHMSLSCGGGQAGQGYPAICQTLQMREDKAGGGKGPLMQTEDRPAVAPICIAPSFSRRPMQQIATNQEDISYAITTNEPPRVYALDRAAFNQGKNAQYDFEVRDDGIASPMVARGPSAISGTYSFQRSDELAESDVSHTLSKRDYKDATDLIATPLAVRRLTPTECERLQGFPDGWTDIPKATDSARYKALGNSVAIPCVKFVLQGIAEKLTATQAACSRLNEMKEAGE